GSAGVAEKGPVRGVIGGPLRPAAGFGLGAFSLRGPSHFAAIAYSNAVNPVVLPPGGAKLLTKPAPTGWGTATKMIGTERVAPCNALTPTAPSARMTSGMSATNSAACL